MDVSVCYSSCFVSYGVVEIQDPKTGAKFNVNGQQLKQF